MSLDFLIFDKFCYVEKIDGIWYNKFLGGDNVYTNFINVNYALF